MKKAVRWLNRAVAAVFAMAVVFPLSQSPVAAQPDINVAPKGANPPNQEPRGPRRALNRGGAMFDRQEMFDRQGMMVRALLMRAGFADANIQDPVVAYLQARQAKRPKALEVTFKIVQAMGIMRGAQRAAEGVPQEELTQAQMLALLADYHAAVEADRAAREEAEHELDAKIKFSENPRLELTLILLGVLGDGSPVASLAGPNVGDMMMRAPFAEPPVAGPFGGARRGNRFGGPFNADRARTEPEPPVFGGDAF